MCNIINVLICDLKVAWNDRTQSTHNLRDKMFLQNPDNPMFLNPATMPIVATFHTLPAPYIAIFVPSTLPTLPVALPVALPTLPGETFSEKTCITSC